MRLAALLFAAAALLAGCAAAPFDPPVPDRIKEGPGLFTGESGAWSPKKQP